MINIWLKSGKSKKHTFEIIKNAIFRFLPQPVKIVEKNPTNVILNLGDPKEIQMNDLKQIVQQIDYNDRLHYGKLRTYSNTNAQLKILEMKKITKLKITFEEKDLILDVSFE